MPTPAPRETRDRSGPGTHKAAAFGVALMVIVCCAGPALIAAGVLAGAGSWLGNPLLIALAVLVAAGVAVFVLRRRSRPGACCSTDGSTRGQVGQEEAWAATRDEQVRLAKRRLPPKG